MIITLTINPAVDRTVSVDKLVFEDRAYILDRSEAAGGRGLNASRVIQGFGAKTLAILTCGGATGETLLKLLEKVEFPYECVRVKQSTRTNSTISDKQGLTIKLNEIGEPLDKRELKEIRELVSARLAKAEWIMICGSIPPGVPPHFYCEMVQMARDRGVKTLLDSEGEALLHAVEARPTIITPNQQEAERLLGRALVTRGQSLDALERMQKMGPESVILSLGGRGAMASEPEGVFEVLPPHVDALGPIGAGDAMAAAVIWALQKKKSFADAVRWGVAAGTAKAILPGMRFPTLEQTRAIYKQVEVRPVR